MNYFNLPRWLINVGWLAYGMIESWDSMNGMNGESLSTNQYHVVYPRINDPIYQKKCGVSVWIVPLLVCHYWVVERCSKSLLVDDLFGDYNITIYNQYIGDDHNPWTWNPVLNKRLYHWGDLKMVTKCHNKSMGNHEGPEPPDQNAVVQKCRTDAIVHPCGNPIVFCVFCGKWQVCRWFTY